MGEAGKNSKKGEMKVDVEQDEGRFSEPIGVEDEPNEAPFGDLNSTKVPFNNLNSRPNVHIRTII